MIFSGNPTSSLAQARAAETPWRRLAAVLAVAMLGFCLAGCGYNTIPTLEEQAKAKWADVQNQYQRRADLIPNLVATVQGYAKQEKDVLTAVTEARAKATSINIDASQLTDPAKLQAIPGRAGTTGGRARPAAGGQRKLSRPEIEPELPRPAIAARRHRKPHRRRPPRLHRGGAALQYRAADLPDPPLGQRPFSGQASRWRSSPPMTPRRPRRK